MTFDPDVSEEGAAGAAMRDGIAWWANTDVGTDAVGPLVSFIVVAEVMRPDGNRALRVGAFHPDGEQMATWDVRGRMLDGLDLLLDESASWEIDGEDDDE